jgi:hypothetical protein
MSNFGQLRSFFLILLFFGVTSTQDTSSQLKIHNVIAKDHPIDQIVGDINKGVQTRSRLAFFVSITLLFLVMNQLGLKKLWMIQIG